MTINWREGMSRVDEIDMTDPHGIWQKLEEGEFRAVEGQERIRVPVDGPTQFLTKSDGWWEFPYPAKGRPPWLHRVMARILLGWEWRDG